MKLLKAGRGRAALSGLVICIQINSFNNWLELLDSERHKEVRLQFNILRMCD